MQNKIFQIDSDCVKNVRRKPNYSIEYSEDCPEKMHCAIYFSSHNIYYPNTCETFNTRIIEQDAFEWRKLKIQGVYKHIFVRDIFKQWYLAGINDAIDTPEKLLALLQEHTQGYRVTTVGSSAGGYAAILYGVQLGAKRVLAFNAQFEINSLLQTSRASIDPLVFRLHDQPVSKYFDLRNFIDDRIAIFYFFSTKSRWDRQQHDHIADLPGIYRIGFATAHHGIPFLKNNLKRVLGMDNEELIGLSKHAPYSPFRFSIKLVGIRQTISFLITQIYKICHKKIRNIIKS